MAKKHIALKLNSSGKVQGPLFLLLIVVVFGVMMAGGISSSTPFSADPNSESSATTSGVCCNTGDGDNCRVQTGDGQTFTFKGQEYGLIKSGIKFTETISHLKDSGERFNGDPIVLNVSDEFAKAPPPGTPPGFECGNGIDDQLFKSKPPPKPDIRTASEEEKARWTDIVSKLCVAIPNDEIVYVCREQCGGQIYNPEVNVYGYGNENTVYDAYFRVADQVSPGIPDIVKKCDTTGITKTSQEQKLVEKGSTDPKSNLQLKTFEVSDPEPQVIAWLSPFCKPAVYLYPEEKTQVHVSVSPVGPMIYSIPQYPAEGGWNVTAYPSGRIDYLNKTFPYLYYEAEIPDEKIEKPTSGYVVAYNNIETTLGTLLPKLGLNKKESQEFKEYWVKVLPDSPYYFIGVVSEKNLNSIAPLTISPTPNKVIRVGLYFEALEHTKSVKSPIITTPKRAGFTVVEWGGIFKRDKNHEFSCFM